MSQCPICQKAVNPIYAPFCSSGCKALDLNRWLKGVYAIPASEDEGEEGGEEEAKSS